MKYVNFADPPSKQAADINANFAEAGTGGYTPSYTQEGDTLVLRTVESGPYTAGRIKASPGIDPDDCITVFQGLTRATAAPTAQNSTGEEGDFFVANDYVYICKSINSWVRIPTTAW
jgi:hypothetical protein